MILDEPLITSYQKKVDRQMLLSVLREKLQSLPAIPAVENHDQPD